MIPLVLALCAFWGGDATADPVNVTIIDFSYQPSAVDARQGQTVSWANADDEEHTATSDGLDGTQGPSLWDSGLIEVGGTFDYVFATAGTYPYHCRIHPGMHGSVSVPVRVRPRSGGVETVFKVIWAVGSIPEGFNADVKIKRPGSHQFVGWKIDQMGTQVKANFTPDAGPGTYSFRARLQNSDTDGASRFSPPGSISVT